MNLDPASIDLLLLIVTANATPIILRDLMADRWDTCIDFGYTLRDGNALFGTSKTWRGLVGAVVVTALVASILDRSAVTGALIGLLTMSGDLCASFIKRRLGMASSSMALLLDQLPESLLPALVFRVHFGLSYEAVIYVVIAFTVFELVVSRLLYLLGIRKRPY